MESALYGIYAPDRANPAPPAQSGLCVVFSRDRIKRCLTMQQCPGTRGLCFFGIQTRELVSQEKQQQTPKYKRLTDGLTQL